MGKTVCFIRHAQSTSNAGEITSDPGTIPITALGKQQAKYTAQYISQAPDLIVYSPYTRTLETAEALKQTFPHQPCEMWPIHEFTYLSPKHYHNTTLEDRRPMANAYWDTCDPEYIDGEGAESFVQFVARIKECFVKIDQNKNKDIVIYTHGLVMRLILILLITEQYSDHVSLMQLFRAWRIFPVPNTAILEVKSEAKQFSRIQVAHLPKDIITF